MDPVTPLEALTADVCNRADIKIKNSEDPALRDLLIMMTITIRAQKQRAIAAEVLAETLSKFITKD